MRASAVVLLVLMVLGVRLVNLNGLPLGHHQWRQTDTAGLARAYARGETSFARPVVEWRGDTSGVAETEFPLYSYTVGLVQRVVGLHHWVPRLLSIAAGLGGLVLAYGLFRMRTDSGTAAWSLVVLAILPMNAFFSRTIQPDAWMHFAFIASLYCGARWAAGGRSAWMPAAAAFAALTILLKLPSIVIGLPLAVLFWERLGRRAFTSPLPWLFAAVALLPSALWYLHAARLGRESGLSFGILGSDKWGAFRLLADPAWYWNVFIGKIVEDHLAIVGTPLVVVGAFFLRRGRGELLFDAWAAAMLIHIVLIPVGHAVHDYYQLPLSVPLAFYAGKTLARFRPGRATPYFRVGVLVLLTLGSGWTLMRLYRGELRRPKPEIRLADELAGATAPDDLCVIFVQSANANDPTVLYLADRKGWAIPAREASHRLVEELSARGARTVAVSRDLIRDDDAFNRVLRAIGAPLDTESAVIVQRLGETE